MSGRKRRSKVGLVGAFVIIVGALVVVAAGVTLGMVSSELKAEHIAATQMRPAEPGGKTRGDVFNAYAPTAMIQSNSTDVSALPSAPDPMTNESFLRALFFTSAVALGVAAVVMGVGVTVAVVGIGWRKP